ncbi:MAG: S9 family peptidase [Bryobacteraceae bacterium]|nr:S9 family peptidase [Bryobacteraceae bacterium]
MKFTLIPVLAAAAYAADPPLIPRELLFGDPERAAPTISPDGKKIAYLAPYNGKRNVWVKTIGKNDDRAITNDTKRGISIFFWQQDSQHTLHLQDSGGDENFHVFQTDIDSKSTKDLTPEAGARAGVVATSAKYPNQMLVSMNKRNKQLFDVYRVDLKTGELALEIENPGDVLNWTADNDMQIRAADAMAGMVQESRVRADAKSPWKVLRKQSLDETNGGIVGFSPDNKSAWMISSVGANAARLVEVDLATDKEKVVAEDPNYDISGAITHPTKNTLEAVSFTRAKTEWQFFDKALEADYNFLKSKLGEGVSIGSRSNDDKSWIVTVSSAPRPAEYHIYDRANKKLEFLYAARPKLKDYKLAEMQPISFPARDGLTIHGYLTMPIGVAKSAPTVMLVHGGPWARDNYGYSGLVQLLANRGYAVLQVNFRGSTGYGKKFLNAGDKEWAAKMHDDLLDAKTWAVKQGYADAKKFAIMGGSYGGYATLVGLTFTPEEFTCGVDIVGPSNIVTLLKSIPPYWAPMIAMFDKRVGSLTKEEDFLRSRSPLFKADRITKPLLIGQGANDPRVKQAESDQIVKAMRDSEKPVEYIVFPNEGHGFANPENNLRFFAATESFLAKHLGGRAEPPSAAHDWKSFLK